MKSEPHSEDYDAIEAAKRDSEAFGALYEKYYASLFRFIYSKVNDKHQCADLAQQVFLKAMLNLKRYQDRGKPFIAWLFRIATNEVNMFFRANAKSIAIEIGKEHLEALAESAQVSNDEETLNRMLSELNQLPTEDAQLIELRFFDQLPFKAVADIYQSKEATIKMRIYRILERIRKTLEKGAPNS